MPIANGIETRLTPTAEDNFQVNRVKASYKGMVIKI
jgi:hypothetical protein